MAAGGGWEQQEQLASLRRFLDGFRLFDWPAMEGGLTAEEQIDLLMESAAEQEYFMGWCSGDRNFYDADDMAECDECSDLFSREHLRAYDDWRLCLVVLSARNANDSFRFDFN